MNRRRVLISIEVLLGLGWALLHWGFLSAIWAGTGLLFLAMSHEWGPLVGSLLFILYIPTATIIHLLFLSRHHLVGKVEWKQY